MILTFNNKILSAGTKWLEQGSSPAPVPADGVKIGNLIWSKFYADYSNCGVDGDRVIAINGKDYSFYWYYKLAQMTPQDGWRVPTTADFDNLIASIGADVNKNNWAHLFATYRGYMPDSYDNQYGTGWDEQVGYNKYWDVYYSCAIGYYDSSRIICGNYGGLYFASESSMRAPVVFCKDA